MIGSFDPVTRVLLRSARPGFPPLLLANAALDGGAHRRIEALLPDRVDQAGVIELLADPAAHVRDDEGDPVAAEVVRQTSSSASMPVVSTCVTATASKTSHDVGVGAARTASRIRPFT